MPYLRHITVLIIFFIFLQLGIIGQVIKQLDLTQSELAAGMGIAIIASLAGLQITQLNSTHRHPQQSNPVILGINLGGTVIPLFFILYFSQHISQLNLQWLILTLATTVAVYVSSKVDRRQGIIIYLFSAIVFASPGAIFFGGEDYLFWAYSSAVLGTLIGGDLLHIADLEKLLEGDQSLIMIGGGGVMDAIFLSGIFAMMSAETLLSMGWMSLS